VNFSALILAGGQSRRMGSDKAWVQVDGEPLLKRTVELARLLPVEEILISGKAGSDYSAVGCPVLLDIKGGIGPLAGIERGLAAVKSPWLLVLAVDLPQMTAQFIRKLIGQCGSQTGVVPEVQGHLEPLAAVYPKQCHATVTQLIAQRRYSARGFAEACMEEKLVRKFSVSSQDAACFLNCNTPDDLVLIGRRKV
jgi:molybdenum cofactor guanylyltransferase